MQKTNRPAEKMLQEKKINPDGWNSQREANDNQHNLSAIGKKEIIPGEWNRHEMQAILNIILALFQMPWRSKIWFLMDVMVTGRPTITNIILAIIKTHERR